MNPVSSAIATPKASAARVNTDAVLQLQAAVLSQSRFDAAAAVFATRVAELLACERVNVGIIENGYAKVVALSHGAALDAQQPYSRTVAAAMDEAIDQSATISLPALGSTPRITLAHAELRRAAASGNACVYTVPMVHLGAIAGAVTLQRPTEQPFSPEELTAAEHVISLAGPLLALKAEGDLPTGARARRWCMRLWQRLTNPADHVFRWSAAGVAVLAVLLLAVPVPYRISAPARLEGSVQRALVAASDGFVQQVSARPGDAVKAGQVLAELAQHDLQLERSKRDSELAQHTNAYGAAFARADRSLLMVNQAKMAEARAQLELVEAQIERAQIKAPFDGIVISGDLSQQLGAPVQRGAVLMVVAPAEQYRLIIETDERDINDVKAGAAGRVALAAMPGTTFDFRIERVTPLAATREGRHFFEVEGKIIAPEKSGHASATLRPGLQGVARIEAASRPVAAMALGRLANWMRLKLWSWGWLT